MVGVNTAAGFNLRTSVAMLILDASSCPLLAGVIDSGVMEATLFLFGLGAVQGGLEIRLAVTLLVLSALSDFHKSNMSKCHFLAPPVPLHIFLFWMPPTLYSACLE